MKLFPFSHGHTIAWRSRIGPPHNPNLSDKVMYLQMAFKQRPLRDGGGKPSLGRLAPWTRQDLCPHVAMGGQTPGVALVGGRRPFPEDLLEDIRESPSSWTSCTAWR